ncbi:MAG: SPFH domain-containing protein [Patescibacteria group bacterium]
MNKIKYWILIPAGLAIISFFVALLSSIVLPDYWLLVFGVVFVASIVFMLKTSIIQVSQNEIWVTEIWGKYFDEDTNQLKPGLHFLIPFGIEQVKSCVYMGQQMMKLYLDEKIEDGHGGGDVEFKDCSNIGVSAYLYFKIEDANKATYEVANVFSAIEEKADGILRINFMMYSLDEAMNLKGKLNMSTISCFTNLTAPTPPAIVMPTQLDLEASEFYTSLMAFGVKPLSFVISDFRLPENVVKERQKTLMAETEKKVTEINLKKADVEKNIAVVQAKAKSEITVIQAEADKKAKVLSGQGEAKKIKSILAASNLTPGQSAAFLAETKKWDAITASGSNDKVILLDGNSDAAQGARFGVGLNATNNNP